MKQFDKMKFEIREIEKQKQYYKIDFSKDWLKILKQNYKPDLLFEIDENAFNLGQTLYGKTKQESIQIQRQNCNQMLKLFAVCKNLIKFLRHKKHNFDGIFYTKNLGKKKNNNDFMLCAMLQVRFYVGPFKKLAASYKYAADYLDMENSLNKMCDFRDNKCTKHRDLNDDRTTGCCSKTICRYTCNAPCPTWNLACKILMCDYIIEKKGFYFTPHTVPIMRQHFTFLERAFSIGQLCRSSKKALTELWLIRGLSVLFGVFLLTILAIIIF